MAEVEEDFRNNTEVAEVKEDFKENTEVSLKQTAVPTIFLSHSNSTNKVH